MSKNDIAFKIDHCESFRVLSVRSRRNKLIESSLCNLISVQDKHLRCKRDLIYFLWVGIVSKVVGKHVFQIN